MKLANTYKKFLALWFLGIFCWVSLVHGLMDLEFNLIVFYFYALPPLFMYLSQIVISKISKNKNIATEE
jgi:hypothetical protein